MFLFTHVSCTDTGVTKEEPPKMQPENFYYTALTFDGKNEKPLLYDVAPNTSIRLSFSVPVNKESAVGNITMNNGTGIDVKFSNGDSVVLITPKSPLPFLNKSTFNVLPTFKSAKGTNLNTTIAIELMTGINPNDKFSRISDDELLTLVQRQTFKYFWDFGHPISGLARERNTSGETVTSGGSGFGIMAIPVGIKRGFITREQGVERMLKITNFLKNKTPTYHGVFPHWLNGTTGATIPFSAKDNGGDLVETSFLMAGLLTARQYFDASTSQEKQLRETITKLWEAVEWDWHTRGEDVLYWHWSPTNGWEINQKISGWNESMITYVLAASSPTHSVSKKVYDAGWARNGTMKNGGSFYGTKLPLGPNLGGPLFFEHYSFMGLDPRKLSDQYANYGEQAIAHSKINYEYCKANPLNYYGYGENCWGLTASDNKGGYSAHSPTNDRGVITPTAALSSMPFTPKESMDALRFFYYKLGDKLFKEYGFVDAFNLTDVWFASSHLAIDQGPIIGMIENHRSQLLWNLLMADPDVTKGLVKLEIGK